MQLHKNKKKEENAMWKWLVLGTAVLGTGAAVAAKYGKQKTFAEYLKEIESHCDKFILKTIKKNGECVKGAKCEIRIEEDHPERICAVFTVYCLVEEKMFAHEHKECCPISSFSDDAETQGKLKELKANPMRFDVERPK